MGNPRNMQDAALIKIKALPNAANVVNTNAIDLGSAETYPVTGQVVVKLTTTAATGANSKNINCAIQHSNEAAANFANIAELENPLLAVVDNAGNGFNAGTVNVALPPGCRRYIRAQATGEANGGNAADGNISIELLV